MWRNKAVQKTAAVLLALFVWQIASMVISYSTPSNVLIKYLPSPIEVVQRLSLLVVEADFLSSVFTSFLSIVIGFFLALAVGVLLAVVAGRFPIIETFLWPYMITIKSVPVASFIILIYVWLSSAELSAVISFLMVLPVVYTNILSGIKSMDKGLSEMAAIYRISFHKRLLYMWIPQIKPFVLSACSLSIGLAWKAGIAAEVIGAPDGTIGNHLYFAKNYFDTQTLLAWTVVVVLLSVGFEKLVTGMLRLGYRKWEEQGRRRGQ